MHKMAKASQNNVERVSVVLRGMALQRIEGYINSVVLIDEETGDTLNEVTITQHGSNKAVTYPLSAIAKIHGKTGTDGYILVNTLFQDVVTGKLKFKSEDFIQVVADDGTHFINRKSTAGVEVVITDAIDDGNDEPVKPTRSKEEPKRGAEPKRGSATRPVPIPKSNDIDDEEEEEEEEEEYFEPAKPANDNKRGSNKANQRATVVEEDEDEDEDEDLDGDDEFNDDDYDD